MNRNLVLFLIFLLIAGVVWYLSRNQVDTSASFDRADSNFKIEDVNTIGRIILTQKNGDRSDLRRIGGYWTINDKHRARQSTVDHLLTGIQLQQLDHIPNHAASEHILAFMAVNGIHVEIFDHNGGELLNFYVGGVTQNERGTYFLKEGSDQPYSLYQPGLEGSLRVRYSIGPEDWRDVRFWVEENDKIDTLKVHYPKQRQHSFVIYKTGGRYDVQPLFSTTPKHEGNPSNRIASYFTTLSQLACEDHINQAPERDSILQMVPFMEMEMIYPDKKSALKFYPAGPVGRSEFSPAVEHYFVEYEGQDFMLGQHNVMKGAFRSYDYFFGL